VVVDVIMTIDLGIKFITSFQKEGIWSVSFFEIFKNYARNTMMVDIVSTLPTLIWNQAKSVYWLKMLRLSHARQAYGAVSEIIKFLLQKAGLNKGSVEKLLNILNLLIYLFSAIHILCCIWIYVGKITECSWVNYCSKNG
jgi:hypothetical protein